MEQELVGRVGQIVQQLGKETGGELVVIHKPREHPNLPGLEGFQTNWTFPAREIEKEKPLTQIEDGAFLARLGVTEEEVLSCSMPDHPPVGGSVVTHGLGIDLARIGRKKRQNRERVVAWLFQLWELVFPAELREAAVNTTWNHLEENLEYLAECNTEEAVHYSNSVFRLPQEVIEMASVLSSPCLPPCPTSPSSAASLAQQLDLSTASAHVVGEDDNFCFTATYLDLEQMDVENTLQTLLSPSVASLNPIQMLGTSSPASYNTVTCSTFNTNTLESSPSLCLETSLSTSASEDDSGTGAKRVRKPPSHFREFTSEKPW